MSFQKLSVASVREEFVRSIENQILSGDLKIGEKLPPARELCSLMGVSLTTVSTGITELANKGFLEVKPRHGVYVADYVKNGTPETFFTILRFNGGKLNAHEIRSFSETRIASDPLVARLVAERASDEQLSELICLADSFLESEEILDACDKIIAFYHELYFLSDNSIFFMMFKTTSQAQKGMYGQYFAKNGIDYAKDTVRQVSDAILKRDWQTAADISRRSMESVIDGPRAII